MNESLFRIYRYVYFFFRFKEKIKDTPRARFLIQSENEVNFNKKKLTFDPDENVSIMRMGHELT